MMYLYGNSSFIIEQIVEDALYTLLSLGSQKFVDQEVRKLNEVPIDAFYPVEAENLYYPQSQFFSKPNWGYPQSGSILAGEGSSVAIEAEN